MSDILSVFHQDWYLDVASADDVLVDTIRDADTQRLQKAADQMPKLIELVGFARNEMELTSLFLALGINCRPEVDELSTKEWLQHVLDCMERELPARPL